MKVTLRASAFLLATLASFSSFGSTVTQQDLLSGGVFNGVYGAYLLGETQPTTASTTSPLRDAGSYAMSANLAPLPDGTFQLFVGAVSDGYFDTASGAGVHGKQDLLGFSVVQDPSVPGQLVVNRSRVANAEGTASNSVNEFATNSVANDGTIALKMALGSGSGNGWGIISATNTSLVQFNSAGGSGTTTTQYTPSAGTGYTLLSATGTVTHNIPTIGATNGWVLNSTFNKEIVAASATSTASGYSPHGRTLGAVTATNSDNRGSATYNDTIGLAAILRTKRTAVVGTTGINHCTAVAVYKITFDGSGNPELRDLSGALNSNGTEIALPTGVATDSATGHSLDLVGTNYFSTSAFIGPIQIAMNDHGDIALATVAVDVTDTSDTGQNQERGYRTDKRIIVAKYNSVTSSYSAWSVAAQSGTNTQTTDGSGNILENPGSGSFVTVDPASGGTLAVAVGNPSLDNDDNVIFTACFQAEIFATGGTTVRAALYLASPVGGVYTASRLFSEGDVIEDPDLLVDRTVTYIPLSIASSDLTNANVRYAASNCFSPNSAARDSNGGLTVACRLTDPDNPTAPTRWTFVYIAPR